MRHDLFHDRNQSQFLNDESAEVIRSGEILLKSPFKVPGQRFITEIFAIGNLKDFAN